MDIYINSYGTYLRKKDDLFEMEIEGQKRRISPKKVRSIFISTGATITTDAIKLAVEHNIDITIADEYGQPIGRFWHSRFGSTSYIRRRQIEVFDSEEGIEIAKTWLIKKIEKSVEHLRRLKYKRKAKEIEITKYELNILPYIEKIKAVRGRVGEVRHILMGYEGNASREYYNVISFLMPPEFQFGGRSFRPAKDEFNCMLNYGYGILYSRVEKACIIAGLDPYVGVLHSDNYNKVSLVFDMIEIFRFMVIESVFRLFTRKRVDRKFFDKILEGFKLNKQGKPVVVEAIMEEFEKRVLVKGKKIKQEDLIINECHRLANMLIGKG